MSSRGVPFWLVGRLVGALDRDEVGKDGTLWDGFVRTNVGTRGGTRDDLLAEEVDDVLVGEK
jgi:hypothetical protein